MFGGGSIRDGLAVSGRGWTQEAVVLASEAPGDGRDARERRLSVS